MVIHELKETVERLHGGTATYVETVSVKEVFNDKVVWQGDVEVFDLENNPKATRAYAWMHSLDDTEAKRHVAVLHVPPIDSPQAAVKAVIVYEYRQQKK
jgi:predicted sulfurtransferase